MYEGKLNEMKSIVILQSNKEEADFIANGLINNFKILLATDNCDKAVDEAIKNRADFLISGLILKDGDAVNVLNRIKNSGGKTQCVIVTVVSSGEIINDVMSAGARGYFVKPIDINLLKRKLFELSNKLASYIPPFQQQNSMPNANSNRAIDERITRIFIGIGIPPHIKGYAYLREGVKLSVFNPDLINNVTKKLYPMISEKFCTTPSKVERAIRHAIEVAWNKGRIDAINSLFGVRVYNPNERPTNSEFIALIADRILLDQAASM